MFTWFAWDNVLKQKFRGTLNHGAKHWINRSAIYKFYYFVFIFFCEENRDNKFRQEIKMIKFGNRLGPGEVVHLEAPPPGFTLLPSNLWILNKSLGQNVFWNFSDLYLVVSFAVTLRIHIFSEFVSRKWICLFQMKLLGCKRCCRIKKKKIILFRIYNTLTKKKTII